MKAERKSAFLVLLAVVVVGGCAQILGADFGRPLGDSGAGGAGAGTSSSSGKSSGTSMSNGGSNQGGGGANPGGGGSGGCNAPADCPKPMSECESATCQGHVCGKKDASTGAPCTMGGSVCDGSGQCVDCNVDDDCPASTSPCVDSLCSNHSCSMKPKADGTTCGTGLTCEGGVCACQTDAQCPASTTLCQVTKCDNMACTFENQASGTQCNDSGGSVCDGQGSCVECNTTSDCQSTGTSCAAVACTSNQCKVTDAQSETACSDNGGAVCDGHGNCVGCVTQGDCTPDQCQNAACTSDVCSYSNKQDGASCNENGGNACVNGVCLNHCTNGVKDVDETDVDCGGAVCPGCANGKVCSVGTDCDSGYCTAGACAPWATSVTTGGHHACAVMTSGQLKCWGANGHAQLADGTTTDRTKPVPAQAPGGLTQVSAGWTHTCGIQSGGGVLFCWGDDTSGQLGNGSTGDQVPPMMIGSPFSRIAAGFSTTCAVGNSGGGQALCWGANGQGQVGNGTQVDAHAPFAVQGFGNAAAIATGDQFSCGITNGSPAQVKCWGLNAFGTLGDGNLAGHNGSCAGQDCSTIPVTVAGLPVGGPAPQLLSARPAGSGGLACVGYGGAQLYCWGSNAHGQLGDGVATHQSCGGVDCSSRAVMVPGPPAVGLSVSGTFACSWDGNTAIFCWGDNAQGQLGNGTTQDANTPTPVANQSPFAQVSTGGAFACGLTKSGGVRCWGSNSNGQLGNGTMTDSTVPVQVIEQ